MASAAVAALLIASKAWAYAQTGAASVLGSLLDSVLDAGASVINLVAVIHATKPADHEHRFGHGKAEALAGLGQAVFVAGAAGLLAWQSVLRFSDPQSVTQAEAGIGVMLLAIALTFALVAYQKYVVKKTQSTAIGADSLHYTGDLLLNMSVIAALILTQIFGELPIDAVAGAGIAVFILYQAGSIGWQAGQELMDAELPDTERDKIRKLALADTQVLGIHDFRTRRSGSKIFVEIHAEMDRNLSLLAAHAIAEGIIGRIKRVYPTADVIVHEDPEGVEEERQDIQ